MVFIFIKWLEQICLRNCPQVCKKNIFVFEDIHKHEEGLNDICPRGFSALCSRKRQTLKFLWLNGFLCYQPFMHCQPSDYFRVKKKQGNRQPPKLLSEFDVHLFYKYWISLLTSRLRMWYAPGGKLHKRWRKEVLSWIAAGVKSMHEIPAFMHKTFLPMTAVLFKIYQRSIWYWRWWWSFSRLHIKSYHCW